MRKMIWLGLICGIKYSGEQSMIKEGEKVAIGVQVRGLGSLSRGYTSRKGSG